MAKPFPYARLYTLPPALPFLPTLAAALADGTLLGHSGTKFTPEILASTRVFLPNRRAKRVFIQALMRGLGSASLLPSVEAVGDLGQDEELGAFGEQALTLGAYSALPPAVHPSVRLYALARMIAAWQRARSGENAGESGPFLGTDALHLAGELGNLMDQAETFAIDWSGLDQLDLDMHADNWQISRDFLRIVTDAWPKHLAELGQLDSAARRKLALEKLAQSWQDSPPDHPIIIAGSMGTQPATRALMRALGACPHGVLVLPGLDQRLEREAWDALKSADLSAAQHPQTALKTLLGALQVSRTEVPKLGPALSEEQTARAVLLTETMRAADDTESWQSLAQRFSPEAKAKALHGLTLIRAKGAHEEALALALTLREVLEHPSQEAVLVTPDRQLARRVAGELKRFGIEIDDSAGQPMAAAPLARFCLDLAAAAAEGFPPLKTLALLDHPSLDLGLERRQVHRGREALELALFRASPPIRAPQKWQEAFSARRAAALAKDKAVDPALYRLTDEDWRDGEALLSVLIPPLEALGAAFTPEGGAAKLSVLTGAHLHALQAFTAGTAMEDEREQALFDQLNHLISGLQGSLLAGHLLPPQRYAPLLTSLFALHTLRPPNFGRAEPRLAILGPLEARLQQADVMVLGGLVDGTWPATTRLDPWLSRAMRRELGFEPLEARLGLAAHDWVGFLSAPKVVLSFAADQQGQPAIASRWLQRLEAVAGEAFGAVTARGETTLGFARALNRPSQIAPWPRPEPKPPRAKRPDRISITEVETLLANPYAIYARKVLGLRALPELHDKPGNAEKGSLIHRALERLIKAFPPPEPLGLEEGKAFLKRALREEAEAFDLDGETQALWLPRFDQLAEWFVDWEVQRRTKLQSSLTELEGKLELKLTSGRKVSLTGRADRLDFGHDGRLSLIDYKSGTLPEKGSIGKGLVPQLFLGAAMALEGAFTGAPQVQEIDELAYLKASGEHPPITWLPAQRKEFEDDATAASRDLLDKLTQLLERFEDEDRAFAPAARHDTFANQRYDDYAHLARFAEWHAAAGHEDEDGE